MKMNNTHLKIALGFALMTGFVYAQGVWNGTTNDWDTDNWGLSGSYPGQTTTVVSATIGSGTVTVGTAIPNSTGDVSMSGTSTLNVSHNITTANFYVGDGANAVNTVNQSGGVVTVPTFGDGLQLLRFGSTVANQATYNLSGGELNVTQRSLTLGRNNSSDTRRGTAEFSMSGPSQLTISRDLLLYAENSRLLIDATQGATINVTGAAGVGGISLSSPRTVATTYSFDTLVQVTGYNASTSLQTKNMSIFQGEFAQGDTGTAQSVVGFVLDSNGVNPWDVSGVLNLGDGTTNAKGDLEVDVTQLVGLQTINLFNYTTLTNGSFGNVGINFGASALTLGTSGSLNENEYFLDYGTGSNDSITLEYYVIPEPGTLALFAIAGLGMVVGLRRRTKSGR